MMAVGWTTYPNPINSTEWRDQLTAREKSSRKVGVGDEEKKKMAVVARTTERGGSGVGRAKEREEVAMLSGGRRRTGAGRIEWRASCRWLREISHIGRARVWVGDLEHYLLYDDDDDICL